MTDIRVVLKDLVKLRDDFDGLVQRAATVGISVTVEYANLTRAIDILDRISVGIEGGALS